jgi:serine/threonine protein kinase
LKPGNILVTKQGIKLLDFGLARMAPGENDPTLTRPGVVMGTPAYMAPEQREGKPGDVIRGIPVDRGKIVIGSHSEGNTK